MSELSDLIQFPRAIDLKEAKSLMNLIAEKMSAHIGYSYLTRVEINELGEKLHELKPEESDSEFKGNITNRTTRSTSFRLKKVYSNGKSMGYGSLEFQTIPFSKLGEHDSKEVEIREEIKAIIEKYFSERSK